MSKRFSSVEKITLAAMLLAISVALGTISKFIQIPHLSFLTFSFTPTIVVFASLCLGPLYGAIVGGLADLLPAFFYPTGAYNFLLTIVFILLGIIPWCLEKMTKLIRGKINFLPLVIVFILGILALEIYFFYGTDLLDKRLAYFGEYIKVIFIVLSVFMDSLAIVGIVFSERYYLKRNDDFEGLPLPSEISFISIINEVTLLVFFKGLAYYLYFIVISSTAYRVDYWVIVSMLFIGAPLDVLLMNVCIPWMLIFVKKHHYTHEKD